MGARPSVRAGRAVVAHGAAVDAAQEGDRDGRTAVRGPAPRRRTEHRAEAPAHTPADVRRSRPKPSSMDGVPRNPTGWTAGAEGGFDGVRAHRGPLAPDVPSHRSLCPRGRDERMRPG